MATKPTNSAKSGGIDPRNGKQMPLGQPFTRLNAKQAQEASVRARNLRKQVRAQIVEHIVQNLDLAAEVEKAIKTGDLDRINLLQTAFKMIGLHADQADERQKTMSVSASTSTEGGDSNGQAALKLEFEVVDPVKED